jgi:hypothetical protein
VWEERRKQEQRMARRKLDKAVAQLDHQQDGLKRLFRDGDRESGPGQASKHSAQEVNRAGERKTQQQSHH